MLQERIDPIVKGYELHEQIGEGGYGVVYRAYQPAVGRDVAVKIILPQYANHPDFIRRFESEAQLVARLEHPYIVPLYDYWREADGAYLVMRWLRGGSLHDALHAGQLPSETLSRLIEQIGGALAVAHRRGVVHRDLKPANILLDEEGNAYLVDFGIAKDLGQKFSPYQTDATRVIGSPAYISPEQIKGEPITPQTDIYSLGVMLYEILAGQLPFQAPTPIALMFKHISEQMPALRDRRPDLPDTINTVIQKATAKDPAERYPDVTLLVHDFRRALAGLADSPGKNGGATRHSSNNGPRAHSSYQTELLRLPELVDAVLENPYKGLRAFQEADAADFFGRAALTEQLLARLHDRGPFARFLAVVGPSGSGKSSVVRAGLVPAIRRGELPGSKSWFVIEMFPGAQPIEELAQALLRIAVDPPNNLVGPLTLDDQGLLRVVDQVLPGADDAELVLVIDQFEEVFTLVEDEATRTHFLNSLINAITDPYSRVRVIVTLRADFYDRPLLYPGFSELMRERTEVVVPLTPEELKQAIVSPAERNGLRVHPELIEAIVADVGEQPGALPLLQYALTEVFERRSGPTLTLTPYHSSGGVLGALSRRAEEIYSDLSAEQQQAAQQLFLRLVMLGEGVEDTRRRVQRSELLTMSTSEQSDASGHSHESAERLAVGPSPALNAVIDVYCQYRLLTTDHDPITRVPTIEVAHEALIRTWPRLRQWLDASRDDVRLQRRLAAAASEWATSGQERSFLASGARLEQLASWAGETELALNAEERAYLHASLAERDKQLAQEEQRKIHEVMLEQRSRTFLRSLLAVAVVAAVLGAGLSVYAFGQRREALSNAQQALSNAQQANANEQRAVAGELLAGQNAARAEQNASEAATAKSEAQGLALTQGAQAAYNQGNIDLAGELALTAAEQPNPSPLVEQVLASVVYNPGTRMTLIGHTNGVASVVYSPDETMAFSGGSNGTLWDLKTGQAIKRFTGLPGRIREVAFLPDGKRVLTATGSGTVHLWDLSCATPSPQECNVPTRVFTDAVGFAAKNFEVRGIAVRPNHNQFLATSSDFTLKLWDLDCVTPSPQECDTPARVLGADGGHTQEANQVTFTSDGKYALSSSADTTLIVWDVDTGQVMQRLQDPNQREVRGVAILPGDRYALSGGAVPEIIKWDLQTGQVVDRLRGHKGTIYSVEVSADGTRAISGSADNTVIVWDLEKNVPISVLRGHGGLIRQAVFSKDGKHVLSGSQDDTIRVWDIVNGAEDLRLTSPASVQDASASADGKLIAIGLADRQAQIWSRVNQQTPTLLHQFYWHNSAVKAIALSPDGTYVLTGGGKADGTLIKTNLQTGKVELTFPFKTFGYNTIVFTPDGKRVVTGQILPGGDDYSDNRVSDPELRNISMIVWDVATGQWIYKVSDIMVNKTNHDTITSLAITPDGKQIIASTKAGSKILIYDLETGKLTGALDLPKDDKATQLAMTPDGKSLIAGTTGTKFIVWDLAKGAQVFTSEPQSASVTAVAISADGRFAASSTEGEVMLWDLQLKQKIRSFVGHTRQVNKLLFTDNDTRLVSVADDGTTRVWRIEKLPDIIAWARANRQYSQLTCNQEKLYGLEQKHCT